MIPNSSQNHPKSIPKTSQSHPKIIPTTSQKHIKIIYKLSIYLTYTLYIPCIYLVYTWYIPCIYPVYTLLYNLYTLYIPCIYLVYTLYIPCIYPCIYPLSAWWVLTSCHYQTFVSYTKGPPPYPTCYLNSTFYIWTILWFRCFEGICGLVEVLLMLKYEVSSNLVKQSSNTVKFGPTIIHFHQILSTNH